MSNADERKVSRALLCISLALLQAGFAYLVALATAATILFALSEGSGIATAGALILAFVLLPFLLYKILRNSLSAIRYLFR